MASVFSNNLQNLRFDLPISPLLGCLSSAAPIRARDNIVVVDFFATIKGLATRIVGGGVAGEKSVLRNDFNESSFSTKKPADNGRSSIFYLTKSLR